MLKIDNVRMTYENNVVLDNFSCVVPDGEVLAVVGKNGCGKSTLLNIISGVLEPERGEVLFGGKVITGASGHANFMQQQDLLLPHLKIIDNVALPLRINHNSKRYSRTQAEQLLKRFDLIDVATFYPAQLSGGMRQRVALMRACITAAHVLLLDEPFSRLDAITKNDCQMWCKTVWESFGATVVLVTHDVQEAMKLSHSIAVLAGNPARLTLLETVGNILRAVEKKHGKENTRQKAQEHILSFL